MIGQKKGYSKDTVTMTDGRVIPKRQIKQKVKDSEKRETQETKQKVREEIKENMDVYQIKITKLEPQPDPYPINPARSQDRSLTKGRVNVPKNNSRGLR